MIVIDWEERQKERKERERGGGVNPHAKARIIALIMKAQVVDKYLSLFEQCISSIHLEKCTY